jgi:hypothetical protein
LAWKRQTVSLQAHPAVAVLALEDGPIDQKL